MTSHMRARFDCLCSKGWRTECAVRAHCCSSSLTECYGWAAATAVHHWISPAVKAVPLRRPAVEFPWVGLRAGVWFHSPCAKSRPCCAPHSCRVFERPFCRQAASPQRPRDRVLMSACTRMRTRSRLSIFSPPLRAQLLAHTGCDPRVVYWLVSRT
jgi:hypothetical protein